MDLKELVTKLETQIGELNERIEIMFKTNQVVWKNTDNLKQEIIHGKELNKNL